MEDPHLLGILQVVTDNITYFRENPSHLAWTMMHYRGLEVSLDVDGRFHDLDLGLSQDDNDLLISAYSVCINRDGGFRDVNLDIPLEAKLNKTFPDWISVLTNDQYKYRSLYPTEEFTEDYILCSGGNGLEWNSDGFIHEPGPFGFDRILFAGFTQAEVRSDIEELVRGYVTDSEVPEAVYSFIDRSILINENKAERNIHRYGHEIEKRIILEGLDGERVRAAFRFTAYLDVVIEELAREHVGRGLEEPFKVEESRRTTYDYKGVEIDLSGVEASAVSSTIIFQHLFELDEFFPEFSDYRNMPTNHVAVSNWSRFIHKVDESQPEVQAAREVISSYSTKDHFRFMDEGKPDDLIAAQKVLKQHKPNLRYQYLLDTITNLDKKYAATEDPDERRELVIVAEDAADELNLLWGIEEGWSAVEFLVNNKIRDERKKLARLDEQLQTHYELSKGSCLVTMPDNAHPSYVEAGLRIAQEIVDNSLEQKESKRLARQFLRKWK
ncbi:hypothetical protein HOD38_02095 [archaeon]|jgi:hypothetical protein|nr:hypothetical protein [archaeon]MBT4397034.1 hypothetical protein [archaeon]MBT4441025.1 hypothetical protein [archaeon]